MVENLGVYSPIEAVDIGWSQNTVPIASTQVAIKGIVRYSTKFRVRAQSSETVGD